MRAASSRRRTFAAVSESSSPAPKARSCSGSSVAARARCRRGEPPAELVLERAPRDLVREEPEQRQRRDRRHDRPRQQPQQQPPPWSVGAARAPPSRLIVPHFTAADDCGRPSRRDTMRAEDS
jgi:hypothetical protein